MKLGFSIWEGGEVRVLGGFGGGDRRKMGNEGEKDTKRDLKSRFNQKRDLKLRFKLDPT